jgi:hypothetical protein
MRSSITAAIVLGSMLAIPNRSTAQTPAGDVTFKVPVNLTRLSLDITKVRVDCRLQSNAILFVDPQGQETHSMRVQTDIPVTGGQLVTTATVVFSNFSLLNPSGVSASYECDLLGYSATQATWSPFSASAPVPAFRLTSTPAPIPGTFVW